MWVKQLSGFRSPTWPALILATCVIHSYLLHLFLSILYELDHLYHWIGQYFIAIYSVMDVDMSHFYVYGMCDACATLEVCVLSRQFVHWWCVSTYSKQCSHYSLLPQYISQRRNLWCSNVQGLHQALCVTTASFNHIRIVCCNVFVLGARREFYTLQCRYIFSRVLYFYEVPPSVQKTYGLAVPYYSCVQYASVSIYPFISFFFFRKAKGQGSLYVEGDKWQENSQKQFRNTTP